MAERFEIHPETPQPRLVEAAVDIIRRGGLAVYPTDSSYALGCHLGNAEAVARIRRIREKDRRPRNSMVCRDLSDISTYARVDNQAYRLLKKLTPGPYTFLFRATREVPKRLMESKRKTIGIRVPDNAVAQALLAEHGAPLLSSTARLPDEPHPLTDPADIVERLGPLVDVIVDAGRGGYQPTSVIDLSSGSPEVVRAGAGDVSMFL